MSKMIEMDNESPIPRRVKKIWGILSPKGSGIDKKVATFGTAAEIYFIRKKSWDTSLMTLNFKEV